MSVLFVYSDPKCSCTKKRVFQIVPRLREEINVSMVRVDDLCESHILEKDVVVYQRLGANSEKITKQQETFLLGLITKYPKTLFVYDIDDLVVYDMGGLPLEFIKRCSAVWVTTVPLLERIKVFNPNVFLVQNFVDEVEFSIAHRIPPKEGKKYKIVWASTGSLGSGIALKMIKDLGKKMDDIEIHFFGDLKKMTELDAAELSKRILVHPIVVMNTLYGHIKGADLLINPMEVTDKLGTCVSNKCGAFSLWDFINCKSELKYMKAGLARIPVLTTPTDPFRAVIKDGVNGFLVEKDDWAETITRLLEDVGLRRSVGDAAHKDVMENWTVARAVKKYVESIRILRNALFKGKERVLDGKVLVRCRGDFGTVLCLAPVIRELKRDNPKCRISVSTRFNDIFCGNPYVGELVELGCGYGYSKVFDLDCGVGSGSDLVDKFSKEVLGRLVGDKKPVLYPDRSDTMYLNGLLADLRMSPGKKLVVVNIQTWPKNKAWDIKNWEVLLSKIIVRGVVVVIIGSASDGSFVKNGFIFSWVNKLSLKQTYLLLKRAQCFIGGGVEMIHMAKAVGLPVVEIGEGKSDMVTVSVSEVFGRYLGVS